MAKATVPKGSKLNMSYMDNVVSGSLLKFGSMQIGQFTNEVVRWGNGIAGVEKAQFYFSAATGRGRLSYGLAQQVKEYVREAITDPRARRTNVAPGYFGPPLKDKQYIEWKSDIGRGRQQTVHLMGSLAAAFGVVKTSNSGHSLGIKANVYVKQPLVGKVPLAFGHKVSVADYAYAVESGSTGMPARPIMSGAIVNYIQQVIPEWGPLLKKYFLDMYGWGSQNRASNDTGVNPTKYKKEKEVTVSLQQQAILGSSDARTIGEVLIPAAKDFDSLNVWLENISKGVKAGVTAALDDEQWEMLETRLDEAFSKYFKSPASFNRFLEALFKGEDVEDLTEISNLGGQI